MFKLFGRMLGKKPGVEAGQGVTEPPSPDEEAPVSNAARQALERFIVLVTAHLEEEERRRLVKGVLSPLHPGQTVEDAIQNGILDDGQRTGQWLLLQVDWKAADEVEWQANELLLAAGIDDTWELDDEEEASVPQALLAFSSWVERHGMRLLHLDLGHDAYYALLMRQEKVDETLRAARDAGLILRDAAAFAARET